MLYVNEYFKNYEEFKNIFGIRDDGGRKNKIVLSALKYALSNRWDNKEWSIERDNLFSRRYGLGEIYDWALDVVKVYSFRRRANENTLRVWFAINDLDLYLYTNTIGTDDYCGVTEKGEPDYVRYVRYMTKEQLERSCQDIDNGKVYKKRSAKLMREVINEITTLPEPVLNYVCETFASRWFSVREKDGERYTLHVNKNFDYIYSDDDNVSAVSGSCMNGEERYGFYVNHCDAKAAYLFDEREEVIVARCIIFQCVRDNEGNEYRYAERQYSREGKQFLKELLIRKLIEDDRIDIYKETTAGCYDKTKILYAKDASRFDKQLYVDFDLKHGDTLSFQDTFAYYDLENGEATNIECYGYNHRLDTTDSVFEGEWDSYHDRYCAEVVTVYVWDYYHEHYCEETCDAYDLEDFNESHDGEYLNDATMIDGEYYRNDECVKMYDGEWALEEDCVRITDSEWALQEDCELQDDNKYVLKNELAEAA